MVWLTVLGLAAGGARDAGCVACARLILPGAAVDAARLLGRGLRLTLRAVEALDDGVGDARHGDGAAVLAAVAGVARHGPGGDPLRRAALGLAPPARNILAGIF